MCCGFSIKTKTFFIYELRLSSSREQLRMPTLFIPQRKFKHLLQPRVFYSTIQLVSYCNICRNFYFYLFLNECSTTVPTAVVLVKWFTRCTCQIATSKHNPDAQKLMIAPWMWFRERAFSFCSSSNTNNSLIFFNMSCFSLTSLSRTIAIGLRKSQSKQFLFAFPYTQLLFCNRSTSYTSLGYAVWLSISALQYRFCHIKTCKWWLMLLSHTLCVVCGGFIFLKKNFINSW